MDFLYDMRWARSLGIGRFAREVVSRLPPGEELTEGPRFLYPQEAAWLTWKLLTSPAKVFYSPGFIPPPVAFKPVVLTLYDTIELEVKGLAQPLRVAYLRHYLKPLAQRAYRVVTTSEHSKVKIAEHFGVPLERIVNVGCGVDPVFSPEGERFDPGFPYVLYVGAHSAHKNLARLYEAFGQLKASGQLEGDLARLKLIVSGKPSSEERHLLLRLGLHQEVVFAGFIPDEQLPAYYRGAQALVLVSLYEGFGLPVLEAMACGTPVVTSDRTSLPEVAGEAAVLVNPLEVSSIASGLERILSDERLRAELRAKGLARAAEFSWDTTAAKVRAVLEAALGQANKIQRS